MWRFRVSVGLVLFGLAGLVVLVALEQSGASLIAYLSLWAGAAYLTWQGFRALLGKIEPRRTQTAPPPDPLAVPDVLLTTTDSSRPQEPPEVLTSPLSSLENGPLNTGSPLPGARAGRWEVARAVMEALKGTALFMRRTVVVLVLLIVVPTTLGLLIGGIVLLYKGNIPRAAFVFLAAGCIAEGCRRSLWEYSHDDEELHEGMTGTVPASTESVSTVVPPAMSLPEEFVLLCQLDSGEVYNCGKATNGCAAAELGELALRRRLRVVPRKKIKLFSFQIYFRPVKIHLSDATPTGLVWADSILANLERHITSNGGPISLYKWYRLRGDEALLLHRAALTERALLLRDFRGELHYPDAAVRNALIGRLQAVSSELVPTDEHMRLLLDLVEGAYLYRNLGLTLTLRQRIDRARRTGAVAALPEDLMDSSSALSVRMRFPRQ